MNQKVFTNRTSTEDFIEQVSGTREDFTWERIGIIILHNVKVPLWVYVCKQFP